MRSQLLAVTLLLACAGCDLPGLGGPSRRMLVVQHHLVECVGVDVQRCMLIKEPGAAAFGITYDGIEGLQYEWGTVYELEVREHRVKNPPADGSSIRTVLRRMLSSTRVPAGTEFDLVLRASPERVTEVTPGRYRFTLGPDFTCGPTVSCGELLASFGPGRQIQFRFAHPAEATAPLIVLAWTVCGPAPGLYLCDPA